MDKWMDSMAYLNIPADGAAEESLDSAEDIMAQLAAGYVPESAAIAVYGTENAPEENPRDIWRKLAEAAPRQIRRYSQAEKEAEYLQDSLPKNGGEAESSIPGGESAILLFNVELGSALLAGETELTAAITQYASILETAPLRRAAEILNEYLDKDWNAAACFFADRSLLAACG